jgi:hypothetical protein
LKIDGSITSLAKNLFFAKPMPDGIGEDEALPSVDANTMDALVAIRCALRFSVRLRVRRASSLESSTMSMPLTGEGVRHRYVIDLSESVTSGESSTSPPSSSSSDA